MRSIDLLVDDVPRSIDFYTRYFQAGVISESDRDATLSLGSERQLHLHGRAGLPRPASSPGLCVSLSAASLTRVVLCPGALSSSFQASRSPKPDRLPVRVFDPDGYSWAVCMQPINPAPAAGL
jgi:hypothetical protein